jgi:peptide/nickel transport system substrate-binding protein
MAGPQNDEQQRSEKNKAAVRRRRVLQGMGTAGVAGLSGCSGIFGGNGDGSGSGNGENELGEEVETLNYLAPNTVIQDWSRQLLNTWEDLLGLSFNLNVTEFSTWLDRTFGGTGDFDDMVAFTWTSAPERFSAAFFLEKFQTDALDNIMGYENPDYDDLYQEYLATFDEDAQDDLIEQMQEIVIEDVPIIEFFRTPEINAVNTNKWNIDATPLLGKGNAAVHSHMTATPNEDAFTGDETVLNIASPNRWSRPNPLNTTSGTGAARMGLIFDTLRQFSTDGELINWAADTIEATGDSTLEITLRDDMVFHDGEDVTAEDLAFSMEMFANEELPWPKYSGLAANIDSATAETDLTASVTFDPPDATFLELGALFLRIVPQHIWGDIVAEEDDPVNYNMPIEEYVGSGVFEAAEFSDNRVRMEAFDNHWSGNPAYDVHQEIPFDGTEALRASVAQGQTEMFDQSPSIDTARSAADANDDVELSADSGLFWYTVAFDLTEGATSEKPIREAMFHTTAAADVQEVFFDGFGDIANGTTVHPQLDAGGDFPPITEYFDREEARSILRDAGFGWDSNDNLHYPAE